jgi:hypothetical protein
MYQTSDSSLLAHFSSLSIFSLQPNVMRTSLIIAPCLIFAIGSLAKLQRPMEGICRDHGDCLDSRKCGTGPGPWTYKDPQRNIAHVPQVKEDECNMLLQQRTPVVRNISIPSSTIAIHKWADTVILGSL